MLPIGRPLSHTWARKLTDSNLTIQLKLGFPASGSTAGWSTVTVPNAWNATDQSDASMAGSIGWYHCA